MVKDEQRRVLIAYPSTFKKNLFFKEKIDRITKNLEDYRVVAIDDYNEFVYEFLKERVVEKYESRKLRNGDIKKILNSVEYAIIFWDGSELVNLVYQALLEKVKTRIVAVETTKVVNRDKGQKFDVYIGRGTPWGNPFAIGENNQSREDAISKYREYFFKEILSDDKRRKDLLSLKGKVLGCHCKPLACHGDIIADYLNMLDEEPLF